MQHNQILKCINRAHKGILNGLDQWGSQMLRRELGTLYVIRGRAKAAMQSQDCAAALGKVLLTPYTSQQEGCGGVLKGSLIAWKSGGLSSTKFP